MIRLGRWASIKALFDGICFFGRKEKMRSRLFVILARTTTKARDVVKPVGSMAALSLTALVSPEPQNDKTVIQNMCRSCGLSPVGIYESMEPDPPTMRSDSSNLNTTALDQLLWDHPGIVAKVSRFLEASSPPSNASHAFRFGILPTPPGLPLLNRNVHTTHGR
jgi:hypothetical protein